MSVFPTNHTYSGSESSHDSRQLFPIHANTFSTDTLQELQKTLPVSTGQMTGSKQEKEKSKQTKKKRFFENLAQVIL